MVGYYDGDFIDEQIHQLMVREAGWLTQMKQLVNVHEKLFFFILSVYLCFWYLFYLH